MMVRNCLGALVLALLVVSAAACKKDGEGSEEGGATAEPTKENLVKKLRTVLKALEAKDYKTAVKHFVLPKGMSPDKADKALGGMIEKNEISSAGIDVLAEKGTFGKLEDVAPEKAKKRAERAGVPVAETYGLLLNEAEVMAHWDGSTFKLFRLDDVGKIAGGDKK